MGESLRSGNDSSLGGRIVGLTGQSLYSAKASHVDDAAELMELHHWNERLGDVEEAVERCVQHSCPVVVRHEGKEVVTADTGIVDENRDIVVRVCLLPFVDC